MCDIYWANCIICEKEGRFKKSVLPVHIADFCMPREEVLVFCQKHLPQRDIVVHILVEQDQLDKNYEPGWSMGIRYLTKPPTEYGVNAVTPNIAAEHITKIVDVEGKVSWTTEWLAKTYPTSLEAMKATVKAINQESPYKKIWSELAQPIIRKKRCAVCRKGIQIRITKITGEYFGGYYFGRIASKWKKERKTISRLRIGQKSFPVIDLKPVRSSEMEYWECPSCYAL